MYSGRERSTASQRFAGPACSSTPRSEFCSLQAPSQPSLLLFLFNHCFCFHLPDTSVQCCASKPECATFLHLTLRYTLPFLQFPPRCRQAPPLTPTLLLTIYILQRVRQTGCLETSLQVFSSLPHLSLALCCII